MQDRSIKKYFFGLKEDKLPTCIIRTATVSSFTWRQFIKLHLPHTAEFPTLPGGRKKSVDVTCSPNIGLLNRHQQGAGQYCQGIGS